VAKHRAPEGASTDFERATSALDDVTGDYTVDVAHTRIGIRARHAMVTTVRGAFGDFSGEARLRPADPPASSVTLRIRTASIDTGNADRDAHLRSAELLDVEQRPTMAFRSTSVRGDDDGWTVDGDLTIGDVTKPLTLAVEFNGVADFFDGTRHGSFEATGEIRRKDYGLGFGPLGAMLGDVVKLELDLEFIEPA